MAASAWAVAAFAASTRAVVLCWVALAAQLGGTYDTSSSIIFEPTHPGRTRLLDTLVLRWLSPLTHWDGVYFLHLAEHGYGCELFHAFFPLMPILIKAVRASLLAPLEWAGLISQRPNLVLAGCLVSHLTFVGAAVLLFWLTLRVHRSESVARLSAAFFCLTPAGVFMSAVYSESLFACLSFAGMYLMVCWAEGLSSGGSRHQGGGSGNGSVISALRSALSFVGAVAQFTLAAAARSNGLMLCGYVLYFAADAVRQRRAESPGQPLPLLLSWLRIWGGACVACACIAAPFVVFQWYAYWLYCDTGNGAFSSLFRSLAAMRLPPPSPPAELPSATPGQLPNWCTGVQLMPPVYSHLQAAYWGVGLLRYWEPKQIPQFLLAAPMVALGVRSASQLLRSLRACDHPPVGVGRSPGGGGKAPMPPKGRRAGTATGAEGALLTARAPAATVEPCSRAPEPNWGGVWRAADHCWRHSLLLAELGSLAACLIPYTSPPTGQPSARLQRSKPSAAGPRLRSDGDPGSGSEQFPGDALNLDAAAPGRTQWGLGGGVAALHQQRRAKSSGRPGSRSSRSRRSASPSQERGAARLRRGEALVPHSPADASGIVALSHLAPAAAAAPRLISLGAAPQPPSPPPPPHKYSIPCYRSPWGPALYSAGLPPEGASGSRSLTAVAPNSGLLVHAPTVADAAEQQARRTLPFFLHWYLLVAVAVLFMNVQVVTRFVAACPAVYWTLASVWERSSSPSLLPQEPGRHIADGGHQAPSDETGALPQLPVESSHHAAGQPSVRRRRGWRGGTARSHSLQAREPVVGGTTAPIGWAARGLQVCGVATNPRLLLLVYLLGYTVVGSCLFACFLPWT